jgi:shikimate dehydrogenase
MRKFGLIGYPLGHSFSKSYFTEKFHNEDIRDCYYENFPLKSIDKLPDLIGKEPYLEGLNVTIPYKSDVIKFLGSLSGEAREIGAVNVIKIRRNNGKIFLAGFNSDVTGIMDSLKPFINEDMRTALVLGTGGSSRAVCYVLDKLGISVTSVSRTRKPGIIAYSDISAEILMSTPLIVNTTPLGMFPDIESKPDLDYNLLDGRHILFDLVYNPLETTFLKLGAMQGCSTISGIKMLHSQAEKAWKIWNNEAL